MSAKILAILLPSKNELCKRHRPGFRMDVAEALVELTNSGEIEVMERDVATSCFACRYKWKALDKAGVR